jgi:citrate lyase synthetase
MVLLLEQEVAGRDFLHVFLMNEDGSFLYIVEGGLLEVD